MFGFGFEWGKLKILQYYRKNLRNPTPEKNIFYFFKRDCKKGVLAQYGVSSWLDLLEISLKDHTYFTRDKRNFSSQRGLQRAKKYLQKQYEINGKIPLSEDNGSKLISGAIRRGIWVDLGITTWADIIYETFGLIKGTMYLWKGGDGFNRAISWIKEYFNENGILPSNNSDHYGSIKDVVKSKFWIKFGIKTMDDLTLKACGMVSRNKREKWKGLKGLKRAKTELIEYYESHQKKIPTVSMFNQIYAAISSGRWTKYNIKKWNDLLMDTFGKVNQIKGSWVGQKGLERARKELTEYFNIHQKLPSGSLFSPIKKVIKKGYWKEQNIESWNDLLRYIFGRINRDNVTWKGNLGLNRAKKFLIEFNTKHKKYPSINSSLVYGIKRALNKKYWVEFGIFTWEHLIQLTSWEDQNEFHFYQYFE